MARNSQQQHSGKNKPNYSIPRRDTVWRGQMFGWPTDAHSKINGPMMPPHCYTPCIFFWIRSSPNTAVLDVHIAIYVGRNGPHRWWPNCKSSSDHSQSNPASFGRSFSQKFSSDSSLLTICNFYWSKFKSSLKMRCRFLLWFAFMLVHAASIPFTKRNVLKSAISARRTFSQFFLQEIRLFIDSKNRMAGEAENSEEMNSFTFPRRHKPVKLSSLTSWSFKCATLYRIYSHIFHINVIT